VIVTSSPDRYPRHDRYEVDVEAGAERLFAYVDDHRRLAGHMEKRSLMLAGGTMRVEADALQGQAVGSVIRITGRILWMSVLAEEVVTDRVPPLRKTWETRGEPRLLVIGSYRMGFTISRQGHRSHLAVFIDYQLPKRGFPLVLGLLFGKSYAAWCTRRMANDSVAAMTNAAPPEPP
jgi:hypothetical protein